MATVKLYGDLKQYGDKFKMNADTASEALSGLHHQIKGFKQKIMKGHFRVRINGQDMTEGNLQFGLHSKIPQDAVIHIIPKVAGAKGGLFSFIAGAALIVTGVFAFGATTAIGMSLIAGGAGLMLGGVAQMLTKIPKTDTSTRGDSNNNTAFSSLDNTIAQGAAMPLPYGEIKTGSKVGSQGLERGRLKDPLKGFKGFF